MARFWYRSSPRDRALGASDHRQAGWQFTPSIDCRLSLTPTRITRRFLKVGKVKLLHRIK
ncbi:MULTISPECIES: hypothetical protein [unclassified Coleofasciculus]|uniref:hypothetical protein n=1 Tax=unclassified Coleofasciculus TaxID=2692782 RepID=UPI001882905A|nr:MULTISPECIES: hypothetical protein [unclassified Coleofasciculus]MBE9128258.1 hypothetical protein [Coleofasciculus sp. LEGE 07081]MBE9151306.1 hypothetical protein [Coleofasciculus sp. LEGE 07092]